VIGGDHGEEYFRFLCGLGCRGSTGVTGIARGGDFAGRLAACRVSASVMKLLLAGRLSELLDDCLKGWARMMFNCSDLDGQRKQLRVIPPRWACADFRGAHGRMDFDHKFHRGTVRRTVSREDQTTARISGCSPVTRSSGPMP
jgi:hypothetical protein